MPSDTSPRVTVFIPAYNADAFIGEAIESVLAQTFTDFELLVIDDASTDTTRAIAQSYTDDNRLRLISHNQNQGQPRTRNEGIDLAHGEYIAMLDADDVNMPSRLQQQVAYLDTHPAIDVLGGYYYFINAAGRRMFKRPRRNCTHPADIDADMLFTCPILQGTVMARRHVLAGWRYDPNTPEAQDRDLWSRMAPTHAFVNLPVVMIAYRRHPTQATQVNVTSSDSDRKNIVARQLAALGVDYNEAELRGHALLAGGFKAYKRQTGRPMDRAFIIWTERWLLRLMAANAKSGRYPAPALARAIGRRWWRICKGAAKSKAAGPAVWLIFARSPLKRMVLAAWFPNLPSPHFAQTR